MRHFLLFSLLLTLAVLAAAGCDFVEGLGLPFPGGGTTTEAVTTTEAITTTTEAVTTTEATTTTAPVTTTVAATTTAPITTTAPWLLDLPLSDYITVEDTDYKNVALTLPSYPAITPADVDEYIEMMRLTDTLVTVSGPVRKWDVAVIYYRGEVNLGTADAPIWTEFLGGSNFGGTAHSLEIGSNSFIPGFEDALIGLDPASTGVTVSEDGTVIYISATLTYTDASGEPASGTWTDRVDLTKDTAGNYIGTSRYSTALRDALCGLATGEATASGAVFTECFDIDGDLVPEEVTLSAVTVTAKTNETAAVINVPFPDPYQNNPALAGKSTRWYIVCTELKRPTLADLDYTFVSETIGITYASIIALSGDNAILTADEIAAIGDDAAGQAAAVMEHYREYILAVSNIRRENELRDTLWDTFAQHILDAVEIKAYPEAIRDAYAASFLESAETTYIQYGYYYYYAFDEFLSLFYGEEYFTVGGDTDAGFRKMAETEIAYEMAVYAIAEAEGLGVAEADREATAAAEMQELIEYYKTAYGVEYTPEELREAGITDRYLIENLYFTRVKAHIIDTLFDLFVFADAE